MEQSLRLDNEPDAVPTARRFVARSLRGTPAAGLAADAQLVVTELTTNAVMHAAPPIVVRVEVAADGVRVEVADRSKILPVRGIAGSDAMTGRGLGLVDAVSRRWGVAPRGEGKVVWAELGHASLPSVAPASRHDAGINGSVDSILAGWPDLEEGPPEPRFTITLGDVPTDLLLAAKAHVDNLVREFTLAEAGAASGRTAAVAPHLARLIDTVTTRFAEARQAIKRQALAAVANGEERTRLVLTLPLSAADAGRDYLAALDEADEYARAARLLTLETPPQHRAFRRWYVISLADQLHAIARGEKPASPPSFEQHLLDELASVATARRAAEQIARLQAVTASLGRSTGVEDVADVVVSDGVGALGASGGSLLMPVDDERLSVPGSVGYGEALVEQLRSERRDAHLPAAEALRTGEPVWIESRQERDERFPELRELEPNTESMCAVPVVIASRVLAALRFSFDSPRLFDDDERRSVLALAAQTAQALDRTQLYVAEQRARTTAETAVTRLSRLQRVTASLAAAHDASEVADVVAHEAAETLGATVSALCVVEERTVLRVLGLHGARADTRQRWQTFPVDADLPASEAVRTNRPVVAQSSAELEARFPLLAGQVPEERSLACVPVSAGERRLGALSLSFPAGHVVDDAEVELLSTIGQQCGLALERAQLFAAERASGERSTFVANASAVLTSSLEPRETLQHLMALLVPALADWSVVYLIDDSHRVTVATAAHRDPDATDAMLRIQRQQTIDRATPGGLAEVLQTGRSIRYAHVPEDVRARIARGAPPDLLSSMVPDSAMAVALVVRGRVLGALALARTQGEPYTGGDLRLVEDIAARAAVAVDNAEQFRRERDAALTLQRSMLPQQLPRIDGIALAWRYFPGAAGTHIGGDWYDVIPLEHGRVGLLIGDVMGRGLRAAAVMGQLRATARAHASADLAPAEVLARLDTAVSRLEQDQITTVLFGLLDPASRSLTIASAGHLPPLVTTPTGSAHYLDVRPGPPLGVGIQTYPELRCTLPESATLLLFTDGLVEDRRRPVDVGLEALRVVAETTHRPQALCDAALAALGRQTEHDDDTALLAVGLLGTASAGR